MCLETLMGLGQYVLPGTKASIPRGVSKLDRDHETATIQLPSPWANADGYYLP